MDIPQVRAELKSGKVNKLWFAKDHDTLEKFMTNAWSEGTFVQHEMATYPQTDE